ncbi:MAG: inorganic phosphate transporter, partial [Mesorhizobium sp.]
MNTQLTPKPTLDKDLDKFASVEEAASLLSRGLVAPGLALLFIALAAVLATIAGAGLPDSVMIVAATAVAGYMALAIGANDVTNNVSAAVGAKALTIGSALVIAAIFETAGALIAGRNVVETISSEIIPPHAISEPALLIVVMLSALLAAALWVHIATWIGAPVSTTHSIVGAVLGAGAAALGVDAVNWWVVGAITMSWVVSPVIGALIAIIFLYLIKSTVIYRDDKIAAARRWVPLHVAIMGGAFIAYLVEMLVPAKFAGQPAMIAGVFLPSMTVLWAILHRVIAWQSVGLENRNQSLRVLFRVPLVASAALLSFAHGANDVANAVGPLAAIVTASQQGHFEGSISAPYWVMLVGALGISVGLLLYGPKLVRMVGQQITRLNPVRGFCVAVSVAITVLFASAIGMPVSSTHIAVGAVFGVGFFREWYTANSSRRRAYLARRAAGKGDGKPTAPR